MRPNNVLSRKDFDNADDGRYMECGNAEPHVQIPAELDRLAKVIEDTRNTARTLMERLGPVMLSRPRACDGPECVKAEALAPLADRIRHHQYTLGEANDLLRSILSDLQV